MQVNEPSTTLNIRGRGIARGRRGRGRSRRVLCQGRGAHNTPEAAQPTVEQPFDGTNTIVDRTGRHWTTRPPAAHRRQVQDIIRQQAGVTFEGHKDSIKEVYLFF